MVTLSGSGLTPRTVASIAEGAVPVTIDPAALDRMDESARVVAEVARRRRVYGRTTGVGANRDIEVDGDGFGLLRSHAGGAGDVLPRRPVRAMLAVRANQLLVVASGAHSSLARALVDALQAGAHPAVHEYGSIGTGDLTALAETALTLIGERPWAEGSIPRVDIRPADSLAFLSSSALTIGRAALAYTELRRLADAAVAVAALTAIALNSSPEPFAAEVHAARPHAGAVEVARRLRSLVTSSASRVQDPYGTRAFPQVHGVLFDELDRVDAVLDIELNAGAENPMVTADDVLHHGGWHQASLAAALDGLRVALWSSAQLGAGRLATLMCARMPVFLAGATGESGLLVLEYTAAGALAELRMGATPSALGTAVVSLGVEHHASFASAAADFTQRAIKPYRVVLAAELVAAVRALRLAGAPLPDQFGACSLLSAETVDRPLDGDLRLADELLDELAEVGR